MARTISFLKKNSILLFIGFIILLILASSVTAFYSHIEAAQHQQKKDALLKVRNSLERVWNYVNIADMSFRGYATMQEEKFLEPYTKAIEGHQVYLDSLSYYLSEQNYAEQELIVANERSIKSYVDLVGQMINLVKQNRKEEALAIFKSDPGYDIWITYDKFNKDVLEYVNQLEVSAQQRYDTIQLFTAVVQGTLLLIGIPILVVVISRLQNDRKMRQRLLMQIDNSNRRFIYDDGHTPDDQEPEKIIRHLTQNLEKIVSFIQNIGSKNSEWTELSDAQKELNENTLVGELLRMEEKLGRIKEEDERRFWATQGEGKVAEIARTHQTDLNALGEQLLAYIIKYVNANQGGLFIVNESDSSRSYLEMVACYAYNKKKYEEKIIKPGQGLLGQAFVERKTIRLSQIPEGYVHITSGLGESTPAYLVVLPLKFSEEVLGVLEIASFHQLDDFEVDFLEKIGEIVASSISVVRTSQRTQVLLEESKQQAEEMRAQEEEMRQNMEELQATQEQHQRLQQELQENEKQLQAKLIELEDANQQAEKIRQEEKQRADEQIQTRAKMMEKVQQKFKKREAELMKQLEAVKK
ncbi:MAG: GAF domain-containing protein [Bacteroidota bacterium]